MWFTQIDEMNHCESEKENRIFNARDILWQQIISFDGFADAASDYKLIHLFHIPNGIFFNETKFPTELLFMSNAMHDFLIKHSCIPDGSRLIGGYILSKLDIFYYKTFWRKPSDYS